MRAVNKSSFPQLTRSYEDAGGYDLFSNEPAVIDAKSRSIVGTGVYVEIPEGYVGIIKACSGISFARDIEVGAGVIDSDYRGEIAVKIYNFNENIWKIGPGTKIAQLVILKKYSGEIKFVDRLTRTERGERGFGSS